MSHLRRYRTYGLRAHPVEATLWAVPPSRPSPEHEWLVGIDIGGSSSHVVAKPLTAPQDGAGHALRLTGPHGAGHDAPAVVEDLATRALAEILRADPDAHVTAAATGVAGLASLVADPTTVHRALARPLTAPSGAAPATVVAADALTAHLGALGGRPGAVVVAGTGAIALGTDLRNVWHRADGWGHLLGDLGSGAWIGAAGLRAGLAAHDGRPGGSRDLLAAGTELFGPVHTWPAHVYPVPDRARVLASFSTAVAAVAETGDPVAVRILADAGRHLADSLVASLVHGVPPLAAATGKVLDAGLLLREPLERRLLQIRPDVTITRAEGTPLDGALALAHRQRAGTAPTAVEPWLTVTRGDTR